MESRALTLPQELLQLFAIIIPNSSLCDCRRKGVELGRPEGSGLDGATLLAKHKDLVKALKADQSIRNAAKITSKGLSTVQRVAAAMKD
jgi:hypothetical protein